MPSARHTRGGRRSATREERSRSVSKNASHEELNQDREMRRTREKMCDRRYGHC
ncbi:hypothetical protein SESBI_31657 [Sesbania bispinosa]|nr:hypothetical protein SESBI_31657 [Sesbania bispinosa]